VVARKLARDQQMSTVMSRLAGTGTGEQLPSTCSEVRFTSLCVCVCACVTLLRYGAAVFIDDNMTLSSHTVALNKV
jgi:hypothetical protein